MSHPALEKLNGISSTGGETDVKPTTDLNPDSRIPHICIVGAGISGLRCAEILIQSGIPVTILEARDRIGGRICQSNQLGYPIDLGPQWIHTSGDNPLLKLARDAQVPFHSWNDKINLYDHDGTLLDGERAAELDSLRWSIIDEAFQYSEANEKDISPDRSLYDFIVKRAEERVPDPKERQLLLGMAQMWGDYVGDAVDRQSLKYVWLEECCGGEELIVTSTFENILKAVSKTALASAEIHLGQKVISVKSTIEGQKVDVTTNDGRSQSFDDVVMTTPLGWLKRNKGAFSPPLNARLLKAIDSISVGHLEKVFITFPKAFWLGNESGSEWPAYTNWLAPTYAADTNPEGWPQEAWNLAAYAAPNNHPTLLFYIYGACSAHITSKVNASPSLADTHSFLVSFFHPYFSRLPNYDAESPDCIPKASLATDWYHDELAGYGTYCNFQVGMEDASGDVKALRKGEEERGIWFAGEHSAPFEECGTATGAYLSGEAIGERIAAKWGLGKVTGAVAD